MAGRALTDPEAGDGPGDSRRRVLEQLRAAGTALGGDVPHPGGHEDREGRRTTA